MVEAQHQNAQHQPTQKLKPTIRLTLSLTLFWLRMWLLDMSVGFPDFFSQTNISIESLSARGRALKFDYIKMRKNRGCSVSPMIFIFENVRIGKSQSHICSPGKESCLVYEVDLFSFFVVHALKHFQN